MLRCTSSRNGSLQRSRVGEHVDQQIVLGGYSTSSEYVHELIRRGLNRAKLRETLLVDAASELLKPMGEVYLKELREHVCKQKKEFGR